MVQAREYAVVVAGASCNAEWHAIERRPNARHNAPPGNLLMRLLESFVVHPHSCIVADNVELGDGTPALPRTLRVSPIAVSKDA